MILLMSKINIGLLHGLGGGLGDFNKLSQELIQKGYNVFKIDIPGHESPEILKNMNSTKIIKNIKSKISQYKNIVLFGHSFGGSLAINLASLVRPLGIVLFSTPYYYDYSTRIIGKGLAKLSIKIPAIRTKDIIFAKNISTSYKKHSYYYLKTFSWFMDFVSQTKHKIKNISCPSLIICGSKDNIIHHSHSQKIFSNMIATQKELYILPNSGHMIMHDLDGKQAQQKIFQFLDKIKYECNSSF